MFSTRPKLADCPLTLSCSYERIADFLSLKDASCCDEHIPAPGQPWDAIKEIVEEEGRARKGATDLLSQHFLAFG